MIKDNVIYFGYGDILVGHCYWKNSLELTEIKPPQEIGYSPKGEYEILQHISLTVTEDHLKLMREVKNDGLRSFEVGDYTFDFNTYNPKSVEVGLDHICQAVNGDWILLAC